MTNDPNNPVGACPSLESLARAARGGSPDGPDGSEAQDAAIVEHIEACSACRQRLEDLAAPTADAGVLREAWSTIRQECAPAGGPGLALAPWRREAGGRVVLAGGVGLAPPREERFLGTLGPYDVVGVVGRGAFGAVLHAWDPTLQRELCLKVIDPATPGRTTTPAALLREAQLAARLNHPNIVTVYAVQADSDPPFIAMEFIRGPSLACHIAEAAPLEPARAARIAHDILLGLQHAHRQGILHRDVKPGNVLIEADTGRAKLVDFGLARSVGDVAVPARGAGSAGTPLYMSPEQAAGQTDLDARSDLFAVGAVLYEMLTGVSPFAGRDAAEVTRNVRQAEPDDLLTLSPAVPPELVAIVRKSLRKARAERYQDAGQFAADLERLLACGPAAAGPAASVASASAAAELDARAGLQCRIGQQRQADFQQRLARCGSCGAMIVSKLGAGGTCEACGQPLCRKCWDVSGLRRCVGCS